MTQATPSGWYPDPGQTNDGPPTERWWDGKAWTGQTRPAGTATLWGPTTQPPAGPQPAAPPYGAQPGAPAYGTRPAAPPYGTRPVPAGYGAYPGHPAYPGGPPAAPRRGLRTGIAVVAAAAVLACVGVGVYVLSKDDGGGDRAGRQQGQGGPNGGQDGPGGGPGGSGGQDGTPSPGRPEPPKVRGGGTVPDPLNGISLPVPENWTGGMISIGAQVTSEKMYKCPGDSSETCTAGGAYTASADRLGTKGDTAEEVARADIAANAEHSYGGTTYGGITSHRVLAAKAVTVAGQKGYLVRWKAVTSKGADGYVESVAFPSPSDARKMVVVRFGLDVGQNLSVVDEILNGIKAASGGGDGQDV